MYKVFLLSNTTDPIRYSLPLKIFTLNYDLCIEEALDDITIERGFNDERLWDYKKFKKI